MDACRIGRVADHLHQRLVQRVREAQTQQRTPTGPPVHDDLCAVVDEGRRVRHVFATDVQNELWLIDITEHKTAEGKSGAPPDFKGFFKCVD